MKPGLLVGAITFALLSSPLLHAVDEDTPTPPMTAAVGKVQGDPLALPRHVIATGGGRSAGGAWVIRGTVGQADAEPLQPSTDGSGFYAITGGFWPALPAPQSDWLFADEFEAQAE